MCDVARTESPFLDLLRCQGKHRKQLHHYFHHDVRQYRSGRNRRIDLETLEEVPQTLEQLEKSIVTGCNPTGSLEYSFVTGRQFEKVLKGRTARRVSIPANSALAGGKGI